MLKGYFQNSVGDGQRLKVLRYSRSHVFHEKVPETLGNAFLTPTSVFTTGERSSEVLVAKSGMEYNRLRSSTRRCPTPVLPMLGFSVHPSQHYLFNMKNPTMQNVKDVGPYVTFEKGFSMEYYQQQLEEYRHLDPTRVSFMDMIPVSILSQLTHHAPRRET